MWLEELVKRCQGLLDEETREAFWLRGVSDEQIEQFRLGYVGKEMPPGIEYPESFKKWWGGHQVEDSHVFPLTNWLGEVRGLQIRPVTKDRKAYMDFFLDRSEPTMFGLGQAAQSVWDTGELVVVEGIFDMLPLQRVVPNVISTITATVPEQLIRSLKRFVRKIHLFYDNDSTGHRATRKFVERCESDFEVNVFRYPIGVLTPDGKQVKDPGDLWEAWGDVKLASYVKSQME